MDKTNASAEFMRKARKERGLSKRAAAELIGVDVSTLSRYECKGLSRRVRFSRFARIAKVYGTTTDELCRLMRCDAGAFLRERREELGLSGVAMAERLGCDMGTIIDLEFDGIKGACPHDVLRNICIAYRVSSDDLLALMD